MNYRLVDSKQHNWNRIQLCKNTHDMIICMETFSMYEWFNMYHYYYNNLKVLHLIDYTVVKLKKHFDFIGRHCHFQENYNLMIEIDIEYNQLLTKALNRL